MPHVLQANDKFSAFSKALKKELRPAYFATMLENIWAIISLCFRNNVHENSHENTKKHTFFRTNPIGAHDTERSVSGQ